MKWLASTFANERILYCLILFSYVNDVNNISLLFTVLLLLLLLLLYCYGDPCFTFVVLLSSDKKCRPCEICL